MILALIGKEWREHWPFLLFLGFLLAVGGAALLGQMTMVTEAGSLFTVAGAYLMLALPVASAILGSRLIVREYRHRTQLFLEALPMSRWHMVAVKYVLGLAVMGALTAAALLGALALGWRHEHLTGAFITVLALRAFATAWCWHAFFFMTGFLGRYRWALLLMMVMALMGATMMAGWEIQHFGPFFLLGDTFAFERERVPEPHFAVTLGLAAGFTVVGFGLALVREGNVGALLAEKMSHREKVFIAVLLLGMSFAMSTLDDKRVKHPYVLHAAATAEHSGVKVQVAGSSAEARALADHLAAELGALAVYLELHSAPPVFVTSRRDLDADKYERASLEQAEGVLVRANFRAEAFDRRKFLAWLVSEVLKHHSRDRLALEKHAWKREGFAWWWATRERGRAPLAEDRALALRALHGFGDTLPDAAWPDRWLVECDRVGDETAAAMAWSGVRALMGRLDEEQSRALWRQTLGVRRPDDLRGWWQDSRQPFREVLPRVTGLDEAGFIAIWREALDAARPALAEELLTLTTPRLELRAEPSATGGGYRLKYRLVTGEGENPPAAWELRWLRLPPFDAARSPRALRVERHEAAGDWHELPVSFTTGDRVACTLAVTSAALEGAVISGWRRLTFPLAP